MDDRDIAKELWAIAQEVAACTKCRLHLMRKRAVPGEGSAEKGIMIVGEAPGRREDEEGRPFVGAAGRLLTEILSKNGVERSRDVFITNVVKCRPPNNREPLEDEIKACLPYLVRQIKAIRPRLIIALGLYSARTLLSLANIKTPRLLEDVRGECFRGKIDDVETTICVTYHPAAALYNPRLKRSLEGDLGKFLGGPSDKGLLKYL